jgi:hypothetical protein
MLKSLALLSALAVGTAAVAHADTINGAFATSGAVSYTSDTITFVGPPDSSGTDGSVDGVVAAGTTTGSFLTYLGANGGESIDYFPAFGNNSALPYSTGSNAVPTTIYAPGQTGVELFTTSSTATGESFDFFMSSYDATYTSDTSACPLTCLTVTGDGYFVGSGADDFTSSAADFTFTAQYLPGQDANTTFSASTDVIAATPEPGSLVLLGTGIFGLAGFARRKLVTA